MFSLVWLLTASAALIVLSMLFSISESSFLSLNKLRLRILRSKKDKRAERAGKLLERKEILINTLLVSNDLVNILLSSILTAAAMKLFGEKGVGIATLTVTVLLLIFGEITPKSLSTRNPDAIAYALSLFVSIVVKIMHPVASVFTAVSRVVLKLFGINTSKPKQSYTEEDIKSFIEAGGENGILEKGEKNMMNRVFRFTDLEARDIMVPRTSVVAVPFDSDYRSIVELAQRTRFSRFPVYKKNIDDIVGVLYLKDLLKIPKDKQSEFMMQNVMRPPLFIPGTKKMSSVQQMLQENSQSLAIVIDEYSGSDGILTKEDIYREIFGTAGNNLPWRNHVQLYAAEDRSDFTLDGATLLVELKDIIGVQLESEISETLGGWIIEKLNRMPVTGDSIAACGLRFTITSVKMRRAAEIHITKIVPETAE